MDGAKRYPPIASREDDGSGSEAPAYSPDSRKSLIDKSPRIRELAVHFWEAGKCPAMIARFEAFRFGPCPTSSCCAAKRVGRIGAHRVRAKRPDGRNPPLQSPQLVATTRRRVTASPPTCPTSCRDRQGSGCAAWRAQARLGATRIWSFWSATRATPRSLQRR
jgi:hypothetical protein